MSSTTLAAVFANTLASALGCGVVLLIVAVAVVRYAVRYFMSRAEKIIAHIPASTPAHMVAVAPLDLIAQTDPEFTWDAFATRARSAYEVIQRARMLHRPTVAKGFVSEQMREGLTAELTGEPFVSPGLLRAIPIERLDPVRVESAGHMHRLTVRIVGRAGRRAASALWDRPIELGVDPVDIDGTVTVDEEWVFERPIGAHSSPPLSVVRCPYCGGPVKDTLALKCDFCGHALRQANDDWLVSAIEPAHSAVASRIPALPREEYS